MGRILNGSTLGTGLVSLVAGALQVVMMTLLGLPLVFPVGVLTFFGGFSAYVGGAIATGLGFLIAIAFGSPTTIALMAIFTVVINIVIGNFVAPLVLGQPSGAAGPAVAVVTGDPPLAVLADQRHLDVPGAVERDCPVLDVADDRLMLIKGDRGLVMVDESRAPADREIAGIPKAGRDLIDELELHRRVSGLEGRREVVSDVRAESTLDRRCFGRSERPARVARGRCVVEIERADRALGRDTHGLRLGIDRHPCPGDPADCANHGQQPEGQKPPAVWVSHIGWTAVARTA